MDNERDTNDEGAVIPDQRLEMIFTCCHPAIEEKSRLALTLRTLGGRGGLEDLHVVDDFCDFRGLQWGAESVRRGEERDAQEE